MVAEQKMHFLLCFSSTTWARRTAKPVGEISKSKSWHRARNWEWAGKQNHKAGHGWVWDSDENGSGVWCAGGLSQLGCPGAEEPAQDPAWRISLGPRISNGGLRQAQKSWLEWQRALLCRLILGKQSWENSVLGCRRAEWSREQMNEWDPITYWWWVTVANLFIEKNILCTLSLWTAFTSSPDPLHRCD